METGKKTGMKVGDNGGGVIREGRTSLFVDNLPPSMDQDWLGRIFGRHGKVSDVYIPNRRRSYVNSRLGFVRFDSKDEAIRVATRLNGVLLHKHPIHVHLADYEKSMKRDVGKEKLNKDGAERFFANGFSFSQEWSKVTKLAPALERSYADIVKEVGGSGSHSTPTKLLEEHSSIKEMCVMAEESNMDWLCSTLIGWVKNASSILALEEHFISEGVLNISVRLVGGTSVLLSFPSKEEALTMLNNGTQWMEQWFEKLEEWHPQSVSKSRLLGSHAQASHRMAGSTLTFKSIGELWGTYITIDEQTYVKKIMDRGRVLITTELPNLINHSVKLCINGLSFSISFHEDIGITTQNGFQFRGPSPKAQCNHPIDNGTPSSLNTNGFASGDRSPMVLAVNQKEISKFNSCLVADRDKSYWFESMLVPRPCKFNPKVKMLYGNSLQLPIHVSESIEVFADNCGLTNAQVAVGDDVSVSWAFVSNLKWDGSSSKDIGLFFCSNGVEPTFVNPSDLCLQNSMGHDTGLQLVPYNPSLILSALLPSLTYPQPTLL